jgi:hypothetical protein
MRILLLRSLDCTPPIALDGRDVVHTKGHGTGMEISQENYQGPLLEPGQDPRAGHGVHAGDLRLQCEVISIQMILLLPQSRT